MKLWILIAVLSLSSAGRASAQALGSTDDQKRLELVAKIKKDLEEIDRLLLEAERDKTGSVKEKMAAAQKDIEKLLESAQKNQAQVVSNIEELVRMTKYVKNNSGGDSGDDSQSGGGDPKKQREREKEKDPGELLPQPQQQKPEQGEEPKSGKEQPKNGKEEGGEPDHTKGEQETADHKKPPAEKGEFQRDDTSGRWGVLPQKEAELMQNWSDKQFPEKYRKLLYDFYRRANRADKKQ